MTAADTPLPFACVIPGAGDGTRFGQPKAEAEITPGERFIDRVVRVAIASGANPVLAVVRRGVRVNPPAVAVDGERTTDQLSSVRRGLARLAGTPARGVLLWPVDHPYVTLPAVLAIVDAFRATAALIVVPVYEGQRGHPIMFSRECWRELMTADGSDGAPEMMRRFESSVYEVAVSDREVLRDVNTRADLPGGEN